MSATIPYDPKHAAYLYTVKKWSADTIGEAYGVHGQTVRENLRHNGVTIRPPGRKHYPDPSVFAQEVRAWHRKHGYSPNTSDWRAAHPDGPAYQTVVARLGYRTWADMLAGLGLPPA